MIAFHYLETQKALLHTESIRRGAGYAEVAAFMIAAARLLQAYGDNYHAEAVLECVADLYSQERITCT